MGDTKTEPKTKPKTKRKNKPGAGRPTKRTAETLIRLEAAFSFGCTDAEACSFADISRQTLFNYEKNDPDFKEKKEFLRKTPVIRARQAIIECLDSKDEKIKIRAALDIIDRHDGKAQNKLELTGKEGGPMEVSSIELVAG